MNFNPLPIKADKTPLAARQNWRLTHDEKDTPHPDSPEIKLTVLTQFFPPDYAATGQLIDELVRQLAEQDIQVHVFTGQPGYAFQTPSAPSHESVGGVTVKRSHVANIWPQRIRGKAINGILFCLRAGLYLFNVRHHSNVLLITTAPPFLQILGYLAHGIFGMSYVCLLYDLYPDIANELEVIRPSHWISRAWTWINRRIWQRASDIIVLSSAMKDRVVAKCSAVEGKIHVIHNWANPYWIVPIEKQQNWFAWKHRLVNRFTVLYSGNLGRCHDAETILACAELLQDEAVKFIIVGSGAKHRQLVERVRELGLENVQFLPYQDKEDLPYSLTACDLSLVSVEMGMEGLVAPSKLYPALAAGRPIAVICEPHSYLRNLIRDAQCGGFFQNGDARNLAGFIQQLKGDRPLAERMGEAGRAYLQAHFTPEHIAAQYTQVLSHAVGNSADSHQRLQPAGRSQANVLKSPKV